MQKKNQGLDNFGGKAKGIVSNSLLFLMMISDLKSAKETQRTV